MSKVAYLDLKRDTIGWGLVIMQEIALNWAYSLNATWKTY
jgi:hypothetical protein